ncbi:hypothetical protein J21TS7_46410 [Paenibacillus cineris]|nr:hypothetical protein J21TS7_46410 [Paenibacillus cineris]
MSKPILLTRHTIEYKQERGGETMSGVGNPFTSTGAILVLFILLVIITKSFIY